MFVKSIRRGALNDAPQEWRCNCASQIDLPLYVNTRRYAPAATPHEAEEVRIIVRHVQRVAADVARHHGEQRVGILGQLLAAQQQPVARG